MRNGPDAAKLVGVNVGVVCFGAMRAHLPPDAAGNRAVIEVAEGATVGDAIDFLGAPRALVFAVLVDGCQASLDQPLQEGAEVTLMPPFAGGAPRSAQRSGNSIT